MKQHHSKDRVAEIDRGIPAIKDEEAISPNIKGSDTVAISIEDDVSIPLAKALLIIAIVGFMLASLVYIYQGGAPWLSSIYKPTSKQLPQQLVQQEVEGLTRAVAANPDDPQAYVELGWAYFMAGDGGRAQTLFREALSLDPGHIPALLNMGILLAERKQYGDAKASFAKVVKINPGHEVARFNLGVIAIRERKYDSAIDELNHALRANPTSGDAWYYLGVAQEGKGDKKSAILSYKKATEFLPEHKEARMALAQAKGGQTGGVKK